MDACAQSEPLPRKCFQLVPAVVAGRLWFTVHIPELSTIILSAGLTRVDPIRTGRNDGFEVLTRLTLALFSTLETFTWNQTPSSSFVHVAHQLPRFARVEAAQD
jgi:hypothetical protein